MGALRAVKVRWWFEGAGIQLQLEWFVCDRCEVISSSIGAVDSKIRVVYESQSGREKRKKEKERKRKRGRYSDVRTTYLCLCLPHAGQEVGSPRMS